MLQFVLKIGGNGDGFSCITPRGRNEGVIVDYSTDNEVTWHVLKVVEPRVHNYSTESVTLELPQDAKTERTIFRWWQPLGYGGLCPFFVFLYKANLNLIFMHIVVREFLCVCSSDVV